MIDFTQAELDEIGLSIKNSPYHLIDFDRGSIKSMMRPFLGTPFAVIVALILKSRHLAIKAICEEPDRKDQGIIRKVKINTQTTDDISEVFKKMGEKT